VHAKFGEGGVKFGWMDRVRQQRPAFITLMQINIPLRLVIVVGNHLAIDGFGRMAGPPADHGAAQTILVEDIPNRFGGGGEVGDGANAAAIGRGFGEAVDSVLIGALARGDGHPRHGRKRRVEGGDRFKISSWS
jgi:hypothetical protein